MSNKVWDIGYKTQKMIEHHAHISSTDQQV